MKIKKVLFALAFVSLYIAGGQVSIGKQIQSTAQWLAMLTDVCAKKKREANMAYKEYLLHRTVLDEGKLSPSTKWATIHKAASAKKTYEALLDVFQKCERESSETSQRLEQLKRLESR